MAGEHAIVAINSNGEWLEMEDGEGYVSFWQMPRGKMDDLNESGDYAGEVLAANGQVVLDVFVDKGEISTSP